MNKRELTSQIVARTGFRKTDVHRTLQATLECITQALLSGKRVTFMGFGAFYTHERPPRITYNLYTGEREQIGSRKVIKFKSALPNLKE